LWQPGEQPPPVSVFTNLIGRFHLPKWTPAAISFGPALHLRPDEPREDFLRRAEDAVRGLRQA